MQDWIGMLVAFVKDDATYDFGTRNEMEMKVATPEGKIEIQSDPRWDELVRLGEVFGKSSDQ